MHYKTLLGYSIMRLCATLYIKVFENKIQQKIDRFSSNSSSLWISLKSLQLARKAIMKGDCLNAYHRLIELQDMAFQCNAECIEIIYNRWLFQTIVSLIDNHRDKCIAISQQLVTK